MSLKTISKLAFHLSAGIPFSAPAAENVHIVGVPDYTWYAGCFGSASGNLMGYWDRSGFPNMYVGNANGGVAPLNSNSSNGNVQIRSLWASKAGFDGRPVDKPGHLDDYWEDFDSGGYYESAATDPYVLAGRAEHEADSVCDFMGSSQNKWSDLDGECSGNINAFAFNFWDKTGARRVNFTPPPQNGVPVRDVQSGFRAFARSRGYAADTISQFSDFNTETPSGTGFTFADLKAEIDAGYPVMLYMQTVGEMSRPLPGMTRANPHVHGMLAYGYVESQSVVRYRTSWGSGEGSGAPWAPITWEFGLEGMALRGVVLFRPLPQITSVTPTEGGLTVKWDGPSSTVRRDGVDVQTHWYVVEKADSVNAQFNAVTEPSTDREATVANCCGGPEGYFRVRLVDPPSTDQ